MLIKVVGKLDNSNKHVKLKKELVSFGRIQREDRNILLELTRDSGSIIDLRKRQIFEILSGIAEKGDSEDIALLLSIAKNLKYGYSEKSPMAKFLSSKSSINDKPEKQNTNWSEILKKTIASGLEKNDSIQKGALAVEFEQVFSDKAKRALGADGHASANSVFQQQAKAIKLRNNIIESESFNKIPEGLSAKELEEFETNQLRAKRNLDYFLASSECSMAEKVEILNKLSNMMSPKYHINSQLTDKKVKVLSEMVNDLVIRQPDQDIPNIKSINQRRHGMCSAISRARKALAYQDKLAYVNAIYSELDDKSEMKVFDITQLGRNTKIPVKKTYIDFNALQEKGYRIIDASTLQWMHVSGTIGDGTQMVEKYIPFDTNNYGMFNDSKLIKDLPQEMVNEHNYLRSLIKAKGDIADIEESILTQKLKKAEANSSFDKNINMIGKIYKETESLLIKEFPDVSKQDLTKLAKSVLNIEKINEETLRVHPNENELLKKQKIGKLVQQRLTGVDAEKLKSITNRLYMYYETHSDLISDIDKTFSSPMHLKADHLKNLFKVAVDYRICVERLFDLPDTLELERQRYGIPKDKELTINRIERLIKNVQEGKSIEQIAKMLDIAPEKSIVLKELNKLNKEMSVDIPAKLDHYLKILGQENRVDFLARLAQSTIFQVSMNNATEEDMSAFAEALKVEPKKELILTKLQAALEGLIEEPSERNINEIAAVFGFVNQSEIVEFVMENKFRQQIDEAELIRLAKSLRVEPTRIDVEEKLHEIQGKVKNMPGREAEISELVQAPSAKDMILKNAEKEGLILSRESLDRLNKKMKQIDDFRLKSEAFKRTGENKPQVKDVFKFSKEDMSDLKKIEKSFNAMKNTVLEQYWTMNANLSEPLKELYASVGVRKGHFWLSEEGHSGLFSAEHVRISEQLTGKPHYVDENLDRAVQKIKQTGKSGVSATNVMYKEYSGHAQYVADIKKMPVADSKTGEITEKEVLFHDNTWGPRELSTPQFKDELNAVWKDLAGNERTDYAREGQCGGPEGFILDSKNLRTGIPLDELKTDMGVNKPNVPASKKLYKLIGETGDKYAIFRDLILEGNNPDLVSKYFKFSRKIFSVNGEEARIRDLVSFLEKNPNVNLDTKKLESIDEESEKLYEQMLAFVRGKGPFSIDKFSDENLAKMSIAEKMESFGIYSREAFDKLPENHKLKLLLRKISLYDSPSGSFYQESISSAKTHQELDVIEDKLLDSCKEVVKSVIQTFKKPLKDLKTLEDINSTFTNSEVLINWISKKFNPATDEDLVKKFVELKKMTAKKLEAVISTSTREEFGIQKADLYDFVKRLKSEDDAAENSFNKAIFYDNLGVRHNFYADTPLKEAERDYRNLYIASTYVDMKDMKKYEHINFKKYGARMAFPSVKVFDDSTIDNNMKQTMNFLIDSTELVSSHKNSLLINKQILNILNTAKTLNLNSVEEVTQNLLPLINKLDQITPESESDIKSAISAVFDNPPTELKANLKNFFVQIKKLKKGFPEALVKSNMQKSLKNIDYYFETMLRTEIRPKARNRVKEVINKAIRSLVNDCDIQKEKNIEILMKVEDTIRDNSIFKRPGEILQSLVEEVKHPHKDAFVSQNVIKGLKDIMKRVAKAGNLSELEINIMKNINNGNINKFKNFMQEDSLITLKGNRHFAMLSEEGLKSTLFNLLDPESDNRTLKLFVDSLGLNNEAIELILKTTNPQENVDMIRKLLAAGDKCVATHGNLENIVTQFMKTNNVFKTSDDATKLIFEAIDSGIKEPEEQVSRFVNLYKTKFSEVMQQLNKKFKDASVLDKVNKSRYEASLTCADSIKSVADLADGVIVNCKDMMTLASAINVSEHSPLFHKRVSFLKDMKKLIKESTRLIEQMGKGIRI